MTTCNIWSLCFTAVLVVATIVPMTLFFIFTPYPCTPIAFIGKNCYSGNVAAIIEGIFNKIPINIIKHEILELFYTLQNNRSALVFCKSINCSCSPPINIVLKNTYFCSYALLGDEFSTMYVAMWPQYFGGELSTGKLAAVCMGLFAIAFIVDLSILALILFKMYNTKNIPSREQTEESGISYDPIPIDPLEDCDDISRDV